MDGKRMVVVRREASTSLGMNTEEGILKVCGIEESQ